MLDLYIHFWQQPPLIGKNRLARLARCRSFGTKPPFVVAIAVDGGYLVVQEGYILVWFINQIDSPTIAVLNLNISQNYLLLNLQLLKVFVQLHLPSKEWRVKVNVQRKRKAIRYSKS